MLNFQLRASTLAPRLLGAQVARPVLTSAKGKKASPNRLQNELAKPELQALCRLHGVSMTGEKAALAKRLKGVPTLNMGTPEEVKAAAAEAIHLYPSVTRPDGNGLDKLKRDELQDLCRLYRVKYDGDDTPELAARIRQAVPASAWWSLEEARAFAKAAGKTSKGAVSVTTGQLAAQPREALQALCRKHHLSESGAAEVLSARLLQAVPELAQSTADETKEMARSIAEKKAAGDNAEKARKIAQPAISDSSAASAKPDSHTKGAKPTQAAAAPKKPTSEAN